MQDESRPAPTHIQTLRTWSLSSGTSGGATPGPLGTIGLVPIHHRNASARSAGALEYPSLPLQACSWETSVHGIRFLKRNGFAEIRRTWNPILYVADVDAAALRSFDDRCVEHGYSILRLADLAGRTDHEEKWAALLAEIYMRTHATNPPRPMEIQGWVEMLRKDPPDQEATFLALRDVSPSPGRA